MSDRMKTHGDLAWCELMTGDVDKARDFYAGVIGWKTETVDVGMGPYTLLKAGERPVAGLMACPDSAPDAVGWLAYITVDDLDACTARVEAAGGAVLVPPTHVPTVGRFAVIQDPTGGRLGLATYEDREA